MASNSTKVHTSVLAGYLGLYLWAMHPGVALGDGGVTFHDIATDPTVGIGYRRTESARDVLFDRFKQPQAVLRIEDLPYTPGQSRGNPGVALFDFDRDGDLDVYVTNGHGTPNSLYSNQLMETGELRFKDVAAAAGVEATEQDSSGVCYGDIDNDGDHDLYVLGSNEPNRLFENLGNGTFADITAASQTGGGNRTSTTCSFGDVNGDGLLDLVVANLFNLESRLPLLVPELQRLAEHNQLFVNKGKSVFEDMSQASGLENFLGASWSIAMVDYDMDGDTDIIVADDQGGRKPAKQPGGADFGYIRIYQNDGVGQFRDVTEVSGTNRFGAWMGLSFGDLNGDGALDIFATNVGDYLAAVVAPIGGIETAPSEWASRWFLARGDGTFSDPGVGDLGTTPFGWGTSTADYDNDGDLDIVFHGGTDMAFFVDSTNPGVILQNDGTGRFRRDSVALRASTNHLRRNVAGMAVGDLNNDGFLDIVSASNMDWPEPYPFVPIVEPLFGGQFDDAAFMWPTFKPLDPANPFAGYVWNGMEPVDGSLSVEINDGGNGNKSVRVRLLGTKGLTRGGRVNRDGIGAVVTFRPKEGRSVTKPVVSGGSFASSDGLDLIFGAPSDDKGIVEVLWPGGTRNRLYDVRPGEDILFPEIVCNPAGQSDGFHDYAKCVAESLEELEEAGIITEKHRARFFASAMRAVRESVKQEHQDVRPNGGSQ